MRCQKIRPDKYINIFLEIHALAGDDANDYDLEINIFRLTHPLNMSVNKVAIGVGSTSYIESIRYFLKLAIGIMAYLYVSIDDFIAILIDRKNWDLVVKATFCKCQELQHHSLYLKI